MNFDEIMTRFALALGIGLLIGLERGWRKREFATGSRAAGIRTFTISALLGGVATSLGHTMGGLTTISGAIVVGSSFAAYSAVILVFCMEENRAAKRFSATTAVAAILTFALQQSPPQASREFIELHPVAQCSERRCSRMRTFSSGVDRVARSAQPFGAGFTAFLKIPRRTSVRPDGHKKQ